MLFAHTSRRIAALAFSISITAIAASCSSSSENKGPDVGDSGSGSSSGSGGESNGSGGEGNGTGSTASGSGSTASGSGSTTSGSGGNTGSGGANLGGQALTGVDGSVVTQICGGAGCICSNGIDDDGDGQIDGFDTECTGPLDNDEGSFATGIPGDNQDPKWQDCFFDGNSGGGDDGCRYSTGCLTGELAPTDKNCQVTAACVKFCKPLVPNGCDCFGCCEVFGPDGGIAHVTIASTCTYADIGNPTKCPVCTPSTACNNTCERCELCVGKTSIPADCGQGTGGAPSGGAGGASSGGAPSGGAGGSVPNGGAGGGYCAAPACAPGQQACGVDCLPDCPQGQYCLTGCCIPSVR